MQVPESLKEHIQISNSRRENYSSCPRKFYWRYEHDRSGLEPVYGSTALRYGRVWHFALQSCYEFAKARGWQGTDSDGNSVIDHSIKMASEFWQEESKDYEFFEDYRTFENLVNSFLGYIDRWADERHYLEIIHTEREFHLPIELTPDEEKLFPCLKGKPLMATGIIDLVVRQHGDVWVYEHKTTGAYMQSVLDTLQRSAQVQGYMWAAQALYPEDNISGVMVNMHHLSARKKKDGEYGTIKIDYGRQPQIYSMKDLEQWKLSLLNVADQIERERERDLWPMNLDTCHKFNKQCEFTSLCQQNKPLKDTQLSGFVVRRDV